jgi:hypothetical protein
MPAAGAGRRLRVEALLAGMALEEGYRRSKRRDVFVRPVGEDMTGAVLLTGHTPRAGGRRMYRPQLALVSSRLERFIEELVPGLSCLNGRCWPCMELLGALGGDAWREWTFAYDDESGWSARIEDLRTWLRRHAMRWFEGGSTLELMARHYLPRTRMLLQHMRVPAAHYLLGKRDRVVGALQRGRERLNGIGPTAELYEEFATRLLERMAT